MLPRIHCPAPLASGHELELPPAASRHVQVLRCQPGDALTLFDGQGGQWQAIVVQMGRKSVHVRIGAHEAIEREAARAVHLWVGMPANERMDWLVEKATELGVAAIHPLHTERSVLRLAGERAERKLAHWQQIAVAACEQCGRNRVPAVARVTSLEAALDAPPAPHRRLVLSLAAGQRPLSEVVSTLAPTAPLSVLCGPEGGLSPAEEARALAAGWQPVGLGPRVLRAETAALAALVLALAG
jgi:16S rRNA (uracil1498-N3)-methyltransferase